MRRWLEMASWLEFYMGNGWVADGSWYDITTPPEPERPTLEEAANSLPK